MKMQLTSFAPLLFLAMITYTGCAKQDVVRRDDSLAGRANSSTAADPADTKGHAAENSPPIAPKAAPAPTTEQTAGGMDADSSTVAATVQRQLEKVYFDFDSSALTDSARQTLTADAALLVRNPGVKLRVEGHCDERGSDEYNLAIGQQRAKAAAQYLKALGVDGQRISTLSFGKERPADPGHDEAAWAKNRRDEFIVVR